MTPTERADHYAATLSLPNDEGLLTLLAGQQMPSLHWSSTQNLGDDACSFTLRGPLQDGRWPIAQAEEIRLTWWLCVLRLEVDGVQEWTGRVWDIDLYGDVEDPAIGQVCAIDIACRGLAWTEFTNGMPPLPEAMGGETATVTLGDLVTTLVTLSGGLIEQDFSEVQSTSTNLGPISFADQDQPIDLITRYTRVGDGNDEEQAFYVYNGKPIVRPLCDDGEHVTPAWRLPIIGSGLRRTLRGDERATSLKVVFTGPDDSSDALDPLPDDDALERQFGLARVRTFAIAGVSEDAALATARAALKLKTDPSGVTGNPNLTPDEYEAFGSIQTLDGARVSGTRVKAGDVVHIDRLRPHDPLAQDWESGLLLIVQSVSCDGDSGTVSLTLDQRRIASRPEEDQATITAQREMLAPGAPHSTVTTTLAIENTLVSTDSDTPIQSGEVTRTVSRTGVHRITVKVKIQTSSVSTGDNVWLGYQLDGETVDHLDDTTFEPHRWSPDDVGATNTFRSHFWRYLTRGEHRFAVYVRQDSGTNYTALASSIVVQD